jgi:hypothetical protein
MNTLKFLVVVLWAAGACRRIIRKRLNGIARQQNKGTQGQIRNGAEVYPLKGGLPIISH